MLWIRADGSSRTGLGHVMRTIALAEVAVDRGLAVTYLVASDPVAPTLPARRGFAVIELSSVHDRTWLEQVNTGDVVVFDGYHFTPALMRETRELGAYVAAVDDLADKHLPVDVAINQNPTAVEPDRYAGAERTLLGPRYALIRREFRERRRARDGPARTLLATFGGADTAGLGAQILDVLRDTDAFDRRILLEGPTSPAVEPRRAQRAGVEIIRDPEDVASWFDQADAVVSSAGSTTWELLCMGLPVALIEVASNQRGIASAVAKAGAGVEVASAGGVPDLRGAVQELVDTERRAELSHRALGMIDGRGADRILEALVS